MRVEALIPTYNEAENIVPLLEAVLAQGEGVTALVVDDRSPDGTAALAREVAVCYPGRVDVFERDGPRGRGVAGIAGFKRAVAKAEVEAVVEMDADFSHDPADIPRLIAALDRADVVLGSRYVPGGEVVGWGAKRKLNSGLANLLTRAILGLSYRDCTTGYRIFRRKVLERLPWDAMISTNPSLVEEVLYLCRRHGFVVREIPIRFVDRTRGQSKLNLAIVVACFVNLLQIRLRRYPGS